MKIKNGNKRKMRKKEKKKEKKKRKKEKKREKKRKKRKKEKKIRKKREKIEMKQRNKYCYTFKYMEFSAKNQNTASTSIKSFHEMRLKDSLAFL